MFDIGSSELLVIAVLAIVVIGPKDIPRVMREMGRWTAAARRAAREFQASLEEMARESDLDDLTRQAESQGLSRKLDYTAPGEAPADPTGGPVMTALPPEGEAFAPPAEHADDEADAEPKDPPKAEAT